MPTMRRPPNIVTRVAASARYGFSQFMRALSAADIPMGEVWRLNAPWYLPPEASNYPWAYKLVPTIQFCIELYQSTLAATPLRFYTGDGDNKTEIPRQKGNIVDLWAAANTEQTGYELTEDLVGSLEVYGNAYLFKDYAKSKRIQQFWMLNPETVSPVRGPGRATVRYDVKDGGSSVAVPRDQIIHFKRYDPQMGALGVSRLQALQQAYETERDAGRFQRMFYAKGGMVAGHYSTEQSIDDDDIARLKTQFRQRYQGIENSWDPVFLPKKLAFTRAGLTMAEMDFIEANKLTANQMLKLFKIPPMLAGEMEGGGGLNSDVASVSMMLFLRFGVMPAAARIATKLNEALLASGEFGFGISCEYDFSNDPVMVESWLKQAEMWNKATGAPHISRAEARDRQGLPERPEDEGLDDILVPTTLTDTRTASAIAAADVKNAENPPPPIVPPVPPDNQQPMPQDTKQPKAASRDDRAGGRELMRMRRDRRLRAQEARVTTFARRHFAGQQRRLKQNAHEQAARLRTVRSYDLDELMRELHDPDAIAKARRLIRGIVTDAGDEALADLGLDLAFALHSAATREYIAQKGARLITQIDNTTRDALRDAIGEVLSTGGNVESVIAAIDAVMGERIARSSRIGRTETAAAFNFGTEEGYRQSKVVELKEWLTAGDEHVRDTHRELDGSQVPLDDVFVSSSGARLAFPGDPNANDPAETINCRCTIVAVTDSTVKAAPIPQAIRARMNGHAPTLEEWLNGK
jgi:HK97 family phage portal protein